MEKVDIDNFESIAKLLVDKVNEIVAWINEREKARKGKEFVDSGGKITDEGWKFLEEREHEQAGGEHDPK